MYIFQNKIKWIYLIQRLLADSYGRFLWQIDDFESNFQAFNVKRPPNIQKFLMIPSEITQLGRYKS